MARWERIVDAAKETLKRYSEGAVGNRVARLAAHQLVAVSKGSRPWEVVRTVLAMYLLQDEQPHRFASDVAFDFQLVRRVRALAPVNAGSYWDAERNRVKKVYRDVPPRVVVAMAQPLKEALGVGGLIVAKKEREDADRVSEERHRLATALRGLV